MSELLVSVRSVEEASAAIAGGAAIIDIKEPANGSLGRADGRVIRDIVHFTGKRRPVSAALGEWTDEGNSAPDAGLTYVKWGLAHCGRNERWRAYFSEQIANRTHDPQVVLVAYADWQCAQAPSVEDVLAVAVGQPGSVLLIDTHCKDAAPGVKSRPTLLDWLRQGDVFDICARCRQARVKVALAGSLGEVEIRALLRAQPDWFAVRGAVCDGSDRRAEVCAEKVRKIVLLLTNRSGEGPVSAR